MKTWIIRKLGLRGSWQWACRQMEHGLTVRPKNATGSVKYRFSHDGQNRVEWAFPGKGHTEKWENANMFAQDFNGTDWMIT